MLKLARYTQDLLDLQVSNGYDSDTTSYKKSLLDDAERIIDQLNRNIKALDKEYKENTKAIKTCERELKDHVDKEREKEEGLQLEQMTREKMINKRSQFQKKKVCVCCVVYVYMYVCMI